MGIKHDILPKGIDFQSLFKGSAPSKCHRASFVTFCMYTEQIFFQFSIFKIKI
jgi:hypothetical protein